LGGIKIRCPCASAQKNVETVEPTEERRTNAKKRGREIWGKALLHKMEGPRREQSKSLFRGKRKKNKKGDKGGGKG